jgi:hypothetical protein
MRLTAWFSATWELFKELDVDYDPIERLEARVAELERTMTAALAAMPPDTLTPTDLPSETSSPATRN